MTRIYKRSSHLRSSKKRAFILTCALAALFLMSLCAELHAESVIKIATLAPDGSAWMNTLIKAGQAVEQQTNGRVKFRFYPGGVLGDEVVILKKIRLGQIDGALFSSTGLAMIDPDIGVTEIPFIFDNYQEADYLMAKMGGSFEKGMEDAGFTLLGWTEVGFVYLMSLKPIAAHDDIKGLKIWVWKDTQIPVSFFDKLGLSAVSLQATDVLVALQSGLVDVVYNSPLGAVAMQWFTKIKYLTKLQLSYSIGGVVVKNKTFEKLSPEDRQTMKQIFSKALTDLSAKTRQDNQQALEIMQKEGVKIVVPDKEEILKFKEMAHNALKSLNDRVVPEEVWDRANHIIEEYKEKSGAK